MNGNNCDASNRSIHLENGSSYLQPTQTKFTVRFEDNSKATTHQQSSENETTIQKQSFLHKKFTSYLPATNKRTVARNLLNMPLEDLSQTNQPKGQDQLLDEYRAGFFNEKNIEESTEKSARCLNPIRTAIIDLINRKLNENKRNSSTARIVESEMKETSIVCRELNYARSLSDSIPAFRVNLSSTACFSVRRQLVLKKNNNQLKKTNITNKNKSVKSNSVQSSNGRRILNETSVSSSALETNTTVTTPLNDLNLFQEDHRNAIEQELKPFADFFELNYFGIPFGLEFAENNETVDANNNNNNPEQLNNEALKKNVNNELNTNNKPNMSENVNNNTENSVSSPQLTVHMKSHLEEFTTLIVNTIIKLSSVSQQIIAQLQKEYDQQQVYNIDAQIQQQIMQLDEKRKRITRLLNCFGTSDAFEFTTSQLCSNPIFLNVFNALKLNANTSQFFDSLNDYKYFIEQFRQYLATLEAKAQDKSQFFNEFQLFMYELVFEFKLALVQINSVSREKLEILLSPIRYLIKNDNVNPNLKDPRSRRLTQTNCDLECFNPNSYGNVENSASSIVQFDESHLRKLKYTQITSKLEYEMSSNALNEHIMNMNFTFINPTTPELRQLDSAICSILPAEPDLLDDINPTLFTPESLIRTDMMQIDQPITPRQVRDNDYHSESQPNINTNININGSNNYSRLDYDLSLHPSYSQFNSIDETFNMASEVRSNLARDSTQSKTAVSVAARAMSKFTSNNSRSSSTEKGSSGASNYSPNQLQSPDYETKLLSLNQFTAKLGDNENLKRKSSEANYLNSNFKKFRGNRESSRSSSTSSENSVGYSRQRYKKPSNDYRRINDPGTLFNPKRNRERSRTRHNCRPKSRSRSRSKSRDNFN